MNETKTSGENTAPSATPTKAYTIRFEPMGIEFVVDPAKTPYGTHGEPGSILDIALAAKVELDHACGGFCSCSTCHVIVRQGESACPEPSDKELDELDSAPGLTTQSRLGCQCIPDGTADLVVEIPEWNRNRARESE